MFKRDTIYIPSRTGEARITLADIKETKRYGYNPKQKINDYILNFLQRMTLQY